MEKPTINSVLRITFVIILLVGTVNFILYAVQFPAPFFGDFQAYYAASLALDQDVNPYSSKAVREATGLEVPYPFLYLPWTLEVFAWFTWLPYRAAALVYTLGKLVLVVSLILFWDRTFLHENPLTVPVLFLIVLGFNNPIFQDLKRETCRSRSSSCSGRVSGSTVTKISGSFHSAPSWQAS